MNKTMRFGFYTTIRDFVAGDKNIKVALASYCYEPLCSSGLNYLFY